MGFYEKTVLPRIINVACGMKMAHPHRQRVCADLKGRVLEIGFGSGLNVPFKTDSVTDVTAVEPADTAWKLARKDKHPFFWESFFAAVERAAEAQDKIIAHKH